MAVTREQWKEWTNTINEILSRNKDNINLGMLERVKKTFDDPIWSISQSSMLNIFFMSRDDYAKLLKVLNSYFKSQKIELRVDIDKIKKSYLEEIDKKFKQSPSRVWKKKDLEEVFSCVMTIATTHLISTTYYIPCHLPPDKDVKFFNLGVIEFLHIDFFWETVSDAIDVYRSEVKELHSDMLTKDLEDVFNEYAWVAKIKVDNSDVDMGYSIAKKCVDATIAFISTFYDDGIVKMIHNGEFEYSKTTKFSIDANGKCAIKSQIKFKTGKSSSNSWLDYLLSDNCKYPIECFGVIIKQKLESDSLTNAAQTFLDSIIWYHDAINDKNKHAATIKFATCLETLIPEKKSKKQSATTTCKNCGSLIEYTSSESVRKNFVKWISFFFEGIKVENEKLNLIKTVDLFYDARSILVHGNSVQNYREPLTKYGLWEIGRRLAQNCLKHYLMWVTKEGFEQGITDEQIASYMEERFPSNNI